MASKGCVLVSWRHQEDEEAAGEASTGGADTEPRRTSYLQAASRVKEVRGSGAAGKASSNTTDGREWRAPAAPGRRFFGVTT
jgi:hypothetical protein